MKLNMKVMTLVASAIALVSTSSASAMEPICGQAARIAAAAFKEASSLSYEQRDVTSFVSNILPNMEIWQTDRVQLEKDKYLETYLVKEENARRVDDIAVVVIEAYNTGNGLCVIKSISEPKQ